MTKEDQENETWKALEGFNHYEVSSQGEIRSTERQIFHKGVKKMITLKSKVLKQRWNKACKCYFLDLVDSNGARKTVYPHREVAKAFCQNDDEASKTMVIHLDNNPENNQAHNLQWVTPSDHMSFQFKMGNKDNKKVWQVRKKRYGNGFKQTKSHK